MKKFVSCWLPALCCLAAFSMLSSSCVNEQAEEVLVQQTADMPAICATTCAEPATKVSVMPGEGDRTVAWDKGDALSVFYQNGHNLKYVLDGAGGSPTGLFEYATGTPAGRQFDEIVGVYPYSDGITYAGGYVNVTVPAEQAYAEGSFDPKANVMAGIADEEGNIAFQNLCGYLVLRLYGEEIKVKSVRLSGAMGEQLAGPVEMKVSEHSAPRITDWGSGASDEIVLKCAEPVAVGKTADEETEFWIVVPPMTFMDGISVSVETESGSCGASSDEYIQVFRSEICWMDPLCLASTKAAFTADIVWTYADDAEVDHNLFYVTGETPEAYSREALPLTVDESIVEKYGTELDGAVPDGVTVMCVDDEGGEVDVTGEVTVSGLAVADGVLTAGIEGFEWDKAYTVTMTFALSSTELTLTGTVTTTDRNREAIVLDPACEYTFTLRHSDMESGYGYMEPDYSDPGNGWYYWEGSNLDGVIYDAYKAQGIVLEADFPDLDSFVAGELDGFICDADPAGIPEGVESYVGVEGAGVFPYTKETLTEDVLTGEPFSLGVADVDDPKLIPGDTVFCCFTTYIGQEVQVPFVLSYRLPDTAEFSADIVWTYTEDAEVDHNLFYETGETPVKYSREALPLTVDEGFIGKYGEAVDGKEPLSVAVRIADVPAAGEEPAFEDLPEDYGFSIGNLTVQDGTLVADVEDFEWDRVYEVTFVYYLGTSSDLTLTGTVTTTDRNREALTMEPSHYVFDLGLQDRETGYGYIEKEPVEESYYYWKGADAGKSIYDAFKEAGIIYDGLFSDENDFIANELPAGSAMSGMDASSPEGIEDCIRLDLDKGVFPETTDAFTEEVLTGSLFSTGKMDSAEPGVYVGDTVYCRWTTFIGQRVEFPFRFDYRYPVDRYEYIYLHFPLGAGSHPLRKEGSSGYRGFCWIDDAFKFGPSGTPGIPADFEYVREGCLADLGDDNASPCPAPETVAFYMVDVDLSAWTYALTAVNSITMVGTHNGWNQADAATHMTYNREENCWEIDYTIFEQASLKFAMNDDWTVSWGGADNNAYNYSNLTQHNGKDLSVAPGNYHIKLHLECEGSNWVTFTPL